MIFRDQGRKRSRTVVRRGFLTQISENQASKMYRLIRDRSTANDPLCYGTLPSGDHIFISMVYSILAGFVSARMPMSGL